jgi:hypothetical protein
MAAVEPGSGGAASPVAHVWSKRRLVWHMLWRELSQNDNLQRLAGVGVYLLIGFYAAAFLLFRPWGTRFGEPVLSDWELGARVAISSFVGVLLTFTLFFISYTAERSRGSLKGYFCHPVGVAEVLVAKLLFVLVMSTVVASLVLLPLVPMVQAGVMPRERAAGLAVMVLSAVAAAYLCLVFGVALSFLVRGRAARFRPEHGMLVALAVFVFDSRWVLVNLFEGLLSLKAGITGWAATPGDLEAAGLWATVLSTPSPFEAASNLARAAMDHPSMPAGVVVSLVLVAAVALLGVSRAHRTYPEEVF